MEKIDKIISMVPVKILIIILFAFIIINIVNFSHKKIVKKRGKTVLNLFAKNVIIALIIISTMIKIFSYSPVFQTFASTILMSSSLIVVVLGFVLQEGLSNIVHGFMISIFKPFEVGNRIEFTLDGQTVSGIVKTINLRHTMITTTIDGANLIVPNSKLDTSIFKNFSNGTEINKYPLHIDIAYEDGCDSKKREKAKEIMRQTILENEYVIDVREDKTVPLFIKTELKDSSICLTCFITTKTFAENYTACSQIVEKIIDRFTKEGINFAYPHLEISGKILEEIKEINKNTKTSSKTNIK